MLAHMKAIHITKKGTISFGGVIISIVGTLGLEAELATLDPLSIPSLDINACRHMQLIKNRRDETYSLIIGNREVSSIILPFPNHIDVKNRDKLDL